MGRHSWNRGARRSGGRLRLEGLEDRSVPAVLTVTTLRVSPSRIEVEARTLPQDSQKRAVPAFSEPQAGQYVPTFTSQMYAVADMSTLGRSGLTRT